MNLLSYARYRGSETDKRRESGDLKYDHRTPIGSDYGRLVFSSAFRRLHDKTQVFPLTTDDNIHSRLTHSLEVASVGRSLALNLLADKTFCEKLGIEQNDYASWNNLSTLLEVICLAHDIGNPPLGHFGEVAIQSYFKDLFKNLKNDVSGELSAETTNAIILSEVNKLKDKDNKKEIDDLKERLERFLSGEEQTKFDYTDFDGNAEGFRVLTKLQFLNDLYGLNLTAASLSAFIKYPNVSQINKDTISQKKHGVFYTEKDYMDFAMQQCGITKINESSYHRHPFSYLMEAADTICYLLMDMEDAIGKGWLTYDHVKEMLERLPEGEKIIRKAGNHFAENAPQKKKVVQLRTELMSYFVNLSTTNFMKNLDLILAGQYNKELVFDAENKGLAGLIQKFSKRNVYGHKEIETLELTGDAVIHGLLAYYTKYMFHDEESYRIHAKHVISKAVFLTTLQEHLLHEGKSIPAWDVYDDFDPKDLSFEEKFRIIRDHVACMTDKYALEQYRQLSGQKI